MKLGRGLPLPRGVLLVVLLNLTNSRVANENVVDHSAREGKGKTLSSTDDEPLQRRPGANTPHWGSPTHWARTKKLGVPIDNPRHVVYPRIGPLIFRGGDTGR